MSCALAAEVQLSNPQSICRLLDCGLLCSAFFMSRPMHSSSAIWLAARLGFRVKLGQADGSTEHDILVEKENETLESAHRPLQLRYRRLKFSITVIAVLIIVADLFCQYLAGEDYIHDARMDPLSQSVSKLLLLPPCNQYWQQTVPWATTTFERDDLFAGQLSPESDSAWGSTMPVSSNSAFQTTQTDNSRRGDGTIIVEDREKYNLPPGKSDRKGDVFGTSLFDQLHCLQHIRTFLYIMKSSLGNNNTSTLSSALLAPQEDHVSHCFDYLRQGLICNGDLTLEWRRTEPDGRRFAGNGWGIEHRCRSLIG